MLKTIDLDFTNYNMIMEQVMEDLLKHDYQWNRYQESDTGMVILELMALLTDMQNYYLNLITNEHTKNFLKLLGIGEYGILGAIADLFVYKIYNDTIVLKGMKYYANEIVFETEETLKLWNNKIASIVFGNEPERELISFINLKRSDSFVLLPPSNLTDVNNLMNSTNMFLQIGLENKVPQYDEFRMTFIIDDSKRNKKGNLGFCLSKLVWEIYTDEGWNEVFVIDDNTSNLLYTGTIIFQINHIMAKKRYLEHSLYYLRCRILQDEYENYPVIQSIHINHIPVIQKDTKCISRLFSYSGTENEFIEVDEYLAATGDVFVYEKCGDDKWEEMNQYVEIIKNIEFGCRIIFDKFRFGKVPEKGLQNIKVVCSTTDCNEYLSTLDIEGVTSQKISFKEYNSLPIKLEFMLKVDEHIYKEYKRCCSLEGGKTTIDGWFYNEEQKEIIFGNGRNFFIPKRMQQGLKITDLVFCNGINGNVRRRMIRFKDKNEQELKILNPNPAIGGRNPHKIEDYLKEIHSYMMQKERAVTLQDYKKIVENTPGLLPIIVKVKSNIEDGIDIFIEKGSDFVGYNWVPAYKRAITKQIEKYSIITTRVNIYMEGLD